MRFGTKDGGKNRTTTIKGKVVLMRYFGCQKQVKKGLLIAGENNFWLRGGQLWKKEELTSCYNTSYWN